MHEADEGATRGAPVPAVLAVVTRGDRVLLVRRANPPDAGRWGFPGGKLAWGERLSEAAERELAEESGMHATADGIMTTLEMLALPAHHFVLVAVRCRWLSGEGAPDDDALEVGWFSLSGVEALGSRASADVLALARRALAEA